MFTKAFTEMNKETSSGVHQQGFHKKNSEKKTTEEVLDNLHREDTLTASEHKGEDNVTLSYRDRSDSARQKSNARKRSWRRRSQGLRDDPEDKC